MPYQVTPDRANRDGLAPGPVPLALVTGRPEASLYYPRSRLLERVEVDEATNGAIEDINRGSYVRSFLTTGVPEPEVVSWYKQELKARGWIYVSRNTSRTMRVFLRGDTEFFTLVVRREGTVGRPRRAPNGVSVYEILYAVEGLGRVRPEEPLTEIED